jgi:flagellar biosynthesis/type III secretory pathway protein FliH
VFTSNVERWPKNIFKIEKSLCVLKIGRKKKERRRKERKQRKKGRKEGKERGREGGKEEGRKWGELLTLHRV